MTRSDNLMPFGVPKWIRCYDNFDRATNRYKICFTRKRVGGKFTRLDDYDYALVTHTKDHTDLKVKGIDWYKGTSLGQRVPFDYLPRCVQSNVVYHYKKIWELN